MPKPHLYVLVVAVSACSGAATHPPITPADPLPGVDTVSGVYDIGGALPTLPHIENVVGALGDDSVSITFQPFDGAKDYRVFVLPADGDVDANAGTIKNAVYRCSGNREMPPAVVDGGPEIGTGIGMRTLVDNQMVGGYKRTLADATLGWVYYTPGADRVPVYALGDPSGKADNTCWVGRWRASRVKKYTISETERTTLLTAGWRDDGVAFYAPTAGAVQIRTAVNRDGRFYYADGPEAAAHTGDAPEAAFTVHGAKMPETEPLMRAYYANTCATSHDELAVGQTYFNRIRYQGADQPITELLWSGITEPTTLVVEALDSGCPYPGRLAAQPIAAATLQAATTSGMVDYPAAITLDDARNPSTHEVFINGQADPNNHPRAVARAFLRVSPRPAPAMDWSANFGTALAPLMDVDCGTPSKNCFQQFRQTSADYDVLWHTIQTGQRAIGTVMGELWVRYADWAADTNGKFRMTPSQTATMSADKFLHVTMEVNTITTGRRYPQIIVSDQAAPVQDYLPMGNTVVLQTFQNWPNSFELQVCDHRPWDVNNQCPYFDLFRRLSPTGELATLAPNDEVGEHSGADRRARFDLYLSTTRAYVLLDRKPYGCVDLPSAGVPKGTVTVTFGDVLYHSAADFPLGYHKDHLQFDTERHFDNLGFSSNGGPPPWDEGRLPCVAASTMGMH